MVFKRSTPITALDLDPSDIPDATASLKGVVYADGENVLDHGAVGDGVTDDTAAIQAALDSATDKVVLPAGSTYLTTDRLLVPDDVVDLEINGIIRSSYNGPVVAKKGSLTGSTITVSSGTTTGSRDIVVADATGLAVGDWLFIKSSNVIFAGKALMGSLRQIIDVSGTSIRLDRPFNRTMTTSVQAKKVALATPLHVHGAGAIELTTTTGKTAAALVRLDLVKNPRIEIELRNGTRGCVIAGTIGATVDSYIHDLADDDANGLYGYGVANMGPSRGTTIRGHIERCRHAYTTDFWWESPDKPFVGSTTAAGEPENTYFTATVRDTTSSAVSPHEWGWGSDDRPQHRRRWSLPRERFCACQ